MTARDVPHEVLDVLVGRRADEIFGRLRIRRESFWTAVYAPFMSRDLTRSEVRHIVTRGLRETRGNYRSLVPLLQGTGMEVKYVESRDGHNWENWRDRLREGLSWLFPGPLWMIYE